MLIFLLSFCISTNASMRLFSFHLNILTSYLFHLSDDQLLHVQSIVIIAFSSTYNVLFTYFLHSVYTYKWVTCSSTLSDHPSSSIACLSCFLVKSLFLPRFSAGHPKNCKVNTGSCRHASALGPDCASSDCATAVPLRPGRSTRRCRGTPTSRCGSYPLVNIQKAIENGHL